HCASGSSVASDIGWLHSRSFSASLTAPPLHALLLPGGEFNLLVVIQKRSDLSIRVLTDRQHLLHGRLCPTRAQGLHLSPPLNQKILYLRLLIPGQRQHLCEFAQLPLYASATLVHSTPCLPTGLHAKRATTGGQNACQQQCAPRKRISVFKLDHDAMLLPLRGKSKRKPLGSKRIAP